MARIGDSVTIDTLRRGRVCLFQPARGFRSSLDPVLLASFLAPPYGRLLDIGCGTGALSFLLLDADPCASGVAVEIQPRLAALAAAGCKRNGLAGRLEVRRGDVRALQPPLPAAAFDLVATNPPYRPIENGRPSPDAERAQAHHEVSLTLPEWLDVVARVLRPGGRAGVVFPAERAAELLAGLVGRALAPTRLRPVHARRSGPASRVLVEAERGRARPLRIEPQLVVHGERGYAAEVRRMLGDLAQR